MTTINRITMVEGYGRRTKRRTKRTKRKMSGSRKTSQQVKFSKAAKVCKGMGKRFHTCMRSKLKK